MESLKQAGLTALVTLLPLILTAVAGLLIAALAALTRKLNAEAGESKLAQVGVRVSLFAEAVVRDLEATLRPELALMAADGKLTDLEKEQMKSKAMEHLRSSLGAKGLAELQAVLGIAAGSLGIFLSGVIEGAVERMKAGQVVTETATTAQPLVTDALGDTVPLRP